MHNYTNFKDVMHTMLHNLQKIHCFRLAIKERSPSILDALYEQWSIAIVHLGPHGHIHYNGGAPHTNVTLVCLQ